MGILSIMVKDANIASRDVMIGQARQPAPHTQPALPLALPLAAPHCLPLPCPALPCPAPPGTALLRPSLPAGRATTDACRPPAPCSSTST